MQETRSVLLSGDLQPRRVQVKTGARLHFGLLDSVEPFGGLGVMVQSPGTEVTATTSDAFSCSRQYLQRFREIAGRVADFANCRELPAIRLEVDSDAEPHCGLGSGTQLSLAAAEAMLKFLGVDCSPPHLALVIAGRGKRSAVGIHGYFRGGMIFETSSNESSDLNSVRNRIELPSSWCVAVLKPSLKVGPVFGLSEVEKFSRLSAAPEKLRESLYRLAAQTVLPAAQAGDFIEFSDSLQRYNRLSGELFASIQGGPYNGPEVTSLISWLIARGVAGVGQSSWGPGVFAWFESTQHAETIVKRLPEGVRVITLTHALAHPRSLTSQES